MMKIDNWYVKRQSLSPYHAPELAHEILFGDNGVAVDLVACKKIEGKIITDYSGKQWELGNPKQDYLQYLKDTNYPFDPESPIRDRR